MPNQKIESDLTAAGYTRSLAKCEKCGTSVERWTSPSGKSYDWNTPDHFTDPGVLHTFSCGEQEEDESDNSDPFR